MEANWQADRLLDGFQSFTWPLDGVVPAEGEPDEPFTATLVRRCKPTRRRAVLYVHGWNDYFFQTHVADFFEEVGYDFYALDLRRYGRNLTVGQLAGYITDLADYDTEIDAAVNHVREQHDVVVMMGHSTGGLICALWADRHPGQIDGLILNAPWLDMAGPTFVWTITQPLLASLSTVSPTRSVAVSDYGFTRRALHVDVEGEWEYDTDLKTNPGFVVRFAWARAIKAGHDAVLAGLGIDVPVLCVTSARSRFPKVWDDDLTNVDFILDVDKIAAAAFRLGRHLTLVRVEGALHDVTLSRSEVRVEVFNEFARWLAAYMPETE